MEVKETMRNVEPHLVFRCCPEAPRLPPRGLGADENLAMLKGNHISRPGFLQKTTMQFRHASIGHEHDTHFFKRTQHMRFGAAQLQALLQRAPREILQRDQIYGNLPLSIRDYE